MLPRSPVREHCARAAPPQLKFEDRKCLGAVLWESPFGKLRRGISMSIFEASRINALALVIPVEAACLEADSLETNGGHGQRGVRREVHARGLTTGGDQAGTQCRNHRAVIGAQGELRDD